MQPQFFLTCLHLPHRLLPSFTQLSLAHGTLFSVDSGMACLRSARLASVWCCSSNLLVFCSPCGKPDVADIRNSRVNILRSVGHVHNIEDGRRGCLCALHQARVSRLAPHLFLSHTAERGPHPSPFPPEGWVLSRHACALPRRSSYLCARVHADAAACVCGVHALPARSWMRRGCHPRRTRSTRSTSSGRLPWATKETKRALQLRMHTC
jgi:hypothetical protein